MLDEDELPRKKKITELTMPSFRTVHYKDAAGKHQHRKEPSTANRPVQTIAPGPRFGHYLIDMICYNALYLGLIFALGQNPLTQGIGALRFGFSIDVISMAFYFLFFLGLEAILQRTPGKFLTQSYVIDEYANKPKTGTLALRSVCRLVPFDSFSCLGGPHSRGWHDKWSKTWVVTKDELSELKRLQTEQS